MSALTKPTALAAATSPTAERAFMESQKLPPERRGVTFELLFYRQLQLLTLRIHAADDVDHVLQEVGADICRLLNAERLALYTVSDDRSTLVCRLAMGDASALATRLPIGPQNLPGYVAHSRRTLNLEDVNDEAALRKIHAALTPPAPNEPRAGLRSKQMLVLPLLDGELICGVLQMINNKSDRRFGALEVEGANQLCKTLGSALRQQVRHDEDSAHSLASKYDALVADKLLTAAELAQAVQAAREQDVALEQLLLSRFALQPARVGASLARFFSVPYEPFQAGRLRIEMLHGVLKREFVERQGWMPLEEIPQGLVVLCLDPEATRAARVVPQVFARMSRFEYRVTTQTEFTKTLEQLFGSAETGSIDQLLADLSTPQEDSEPLLDEVQESAAADNELVKFVNKLIVDAYHQKASDIHIEPLPGKSKTGIRLRIDGELQPYVEVPAHFRQALVTRLKIMCDLDISERRKPQDGKISFRKYGPLDIELRVATIPTAGGVEDVVMRILAAGEPIALDQLGLMPHNRSRLEVTVHKPYGLFYVCGPTGSGKTTTLHSILKSLNTPENKIWTAEDPVEITQKGLRQVQINRKAGIDFATLMRAFLRADPDIIMVGESRDRETVAMGIEASLTGHLVFSTLHTNSAPESITRLLDMGMDPFNFADALLGILAQRLAKQLCRCKQSYHPGSSEINSFVAEYAEELRHTPAWQADPSGEAQKLFESWLSDYGDQGRLRMYKPVGCELCHQTGYKGRLGLHELLVADARIKALVQTRAPVTDIFTAAVEAGMRTLKMDGMEKILLGLTDLKQVRAVCIK